MAGPDGIPVGHAFRVVPHAVRVDQVGTGRSRDVDAPAIHVRRHAGDHVFRTRSPAILRPHFADLGQVAADAPSRHHGGDPADFKGVDHLARGGDATIRVRGREHAATHAGDATVLHDELVHAVAEAETYAALLFGLEERLAEDAHDLRACAPREVKTRGRVAVSRRIAGAALRPADGGQHVKSQCLQVIALLIRGEAHVLAAPRAWPRIVLRVVVVRGILPVAPGELFRVVDTHELLLRGVHIEESAQRPERLTAQVGAVFLFQDDDVLAALDGLIGRDETRQPRADDDGRFLLVTHGTKLARTPRRAPASARLFHHGSADPADLCQNRGGLI